MAGPADWGAQPVESGPTSWGAVPVATAATTTKQTTDPSQSLDLGFQNQGAAASQGTTPDLSAHKQNLLSSEAFENDAGEVMFKNPATGQVEPTEKNKHVALRDPADNTVKIFSRTPQTNEGTLSSLGRLLMTGMGSAPPTARAMLPLASGKAASPTTEALKGAAAAGYESPVISGVEVAPRALQQSAGTIVSNLNKMGLDENLAPKTFGILSGAGEAPEGAVVTGQNIESLRRTLGHAAGLPDPVERLAAKTAMDHLDQFYANVPKTDVLAGDPAEAADIAAKARANYAAAMRAEQIDRKMVRAELRSAAANSGMNTSNTIRQRMADVLINPKERRGYSADELAAMEKIVRGTKTQNAIRLASNILGGGGGLGSVVSAGLGAAATAHVGGIGAVAPAIGYGLRLLQNSMSGRQIDALSELIRSRSPLAQTMTPSLRSWSQAAQNYDKVKSPATFSRVAAAAHGLSDSLLHAGISTSPYDILRSIQGAVPSRADQNQQQ